MTLSLESSPQGRCRSRWFERLGRSTPTSGGESSDPWYIGVAGYGERLFGQIENLYGMDILLVPFDVYECSFDLRFHGEGERLSNYRQTLLGGQVWFVPWHEDQSHTVRADSQGLFLNPPMLPDEFYRLGDRGSVELQLIGRDVA